MAVNASRMDEEQKEVSKKETIFRLFGYLLHNSRNNMQHLCFAWRNGC